MIAVIAIATFDRLDGSEPFRLKVRLRVVDGWIHMDGGATGYESVHTGAAEALARDGWVACTGTPGRWWRCTVPADEMRPRLASLGLLPAPTDVDPPERENRAPWQGGPM